MKDKGGRMKAEETLCPACDCYHDGYYKHCSECQLDFQRILESGEPEIVDRVLEWLNTAVSARDQRPEEVTCPKCDADFKI